MRVLMLGNSLTTRNGLPERLGELLGAEVVVFARGGARLAEHLNTKTRLGAATQAALADESWDFVVLQEMSNAPATTPARYAEAVAGLCDQVRAAGAVPVLYGTPAYAPKCPKLARLGMGAGEMHERMHGAYVQAARTNGALLADVASAFAAANDLGLWAADGVHPSEAGSELAAQVLANTITATAAR